MSRRFPPCDVPGCKGQLEPGSRDGRATAWCRTCERRLAQLTALHEKVRALEAAPPSAPRGAPVTPVTAPSLSDADLLRLIGARVLTLQGAVALTKRSWNILSSAAKRNEIPYVRLGRVWLFGHESLVAWNATWKRRTPELPATRELIAALPREEAKAIPVASWAKRAKRTPEAVALWQRKHLTEQRLRRRAALDGKGRAVTLFWWQEATDA